MCLFTIFKRVLCHQIHGKRIQKDVINRNYCACKVHILYSMYTLPDGNFRTKVEYWKANLWVEIVDFNEIFCLNAIRGEFLSLLAPGDGDLFKTWMIPLCFSLSMITYTLKTYLES